MKLKSDFLFSLTLFLVFLICSLTLLVMGADNYRKTVNAMTDNYSSRTAAAYVVEKIRQHDQAGCIAAENGVLSLETVYGGVSWTTYLYEYDGWLCEVMIRTGTGYQPDDGQKIMEAEAFSVSEETAGLLRIVTVTDGQEYSVLTTVRSGKG